MEINVLTEMRLALHSDLFQKPPRALIQRVAFGIDPVRTFRKGIRDYSCKRLAAIAFLLIIPVDDISDFPVFIISVSAVDVPDCFSGILKLDRIVFFGSYPVF